MSENDKTSKPEVPNEDRHSATFNFNFSWGRRMAPDGHRQELLEEAKRNANASPDGVGSATRELASFQFKDGKLRFGMADEPPAEHDLGADEVGSHYEEPFPALASLRRWFNTAVTLLAIGIPVAIAILAIATGQTSETVFFMTIFGLIISGMFISSIRPRRTWLSDLLSDYLASTARRSRHNRATHVEPNDSQDPPV
jgi:hypothetical protein